MDAPRPACYDSFMSTAPKPRPPSGRARKPLAKPTKPAPAVASTLSASDRNLVEKLVRKGLATVGRDFGKPRADDDPIFQPGPPCPGAVEALLEDRYGP